MTAELQTPDRLPPFETAAPLVFGTGPDVAVGRGFHGRLENLRSDDPEFADDVIAALAGRTVAGVPARAFGTLSFRRDEPSRFVCPAEIEIVPRTQLSCHVGATYHRRELPTAHRFAARVGAALERIDASPQLGKVVLGRWLELTAPDDIDPSAVLSGLLGASAAAYVYALPTEAVAGAEDASLVGASPELLVSRCGSLIRSVPLAGSAPRSADPVEDRRRAADLLASAKDHREHRFVVRSIAQALADVCENLIVPEEPHLIATDTMWHLATDIRGELVGDPSGWLSALHLAQLLHPTPAVCGSPRDLAYDVIAELEAEPRGPMTGCVGWVDAEGDGEFAVTIRSALVQGRSVRLFAGAGIVPGSDPQAEVAETEAKLQTVLRALEAS